MENSNRHDYKNAIKFGNIDYQCQLCGKLLDPLEWFFMNSFEFIDVEVEDEISTQRGGKIAKDARVVLEEKIKFEI